MEIVKRDMKYVDSYNNAVTSVCIEGKYLSNETGFPLESTKKWLLNLIEHDLPQYFAITDSDEVIGWCDITPKNNEYFKHIGNLGMGIVKEYRNMGIGREMLEKTIQHAKLINIEKVELEVFSSNERAIKLYKNIGFEHEGVRKKGKKVRGEYEDIILMGKMLK